jgi:hypothetical protein
MASKEVATKRKLKPARKQVEAGEIDKSETIQPGKEYSKSTPSSVLLLLTQLRFLVQ